jgi:hypothetical protein
MNRRTFFATLFGLPVAASAIPLSCDEFEFAWRMPKEEADALTLGAPLHMRFKGMPHNVTVTRIEACGNRAKVYARAD